MVLVLKRAMDLPALGGAAASAVLLLACTSAVRADVGLSLFRPDPDRYFNVRGAASADGRYVYGESGVRFSPADQYWRWDRQTGQLEDLTSTFGGSEVMGFRASADGTVVVGQLNEDGPNGLETYPFRWTQAGGVQSLGRLPGEGGGYATGVNGAGNVVVGNGVSRGFRWTQDTGQVELAPVVGDPESFARDISRDGRWVVGSSGGRVPGTTRHRAVRWGADGVPEVLTMPSDTSTSSIASVSTDGSVLLGSRRLVGGASESFQWTALGGYQAFMGLPADLLAATNHVMNGDGTVFGGFGFDRTSTIVSRAVLWTQQAGFVDLNDLLAAQGISLGNVTLSDVTSISDDGLVISGNGVAQIGPTTGDIIGVAWVVTIPAPGAPLGLVAALAWACRRRR